MYNGYQRGYVQFEKRIIFHFEDVVRGEIISYCVNDGLAHIFDTVYKSPDAIKKITNSQQRMNEEIFLKSIM